jgi:hypothetical protein
MLKELSLILDNTPLKCPIDEIRRLVMDENILQKSTFSGRKMSFYRLKLLYSFDIHNPVFSGLHFFWNESPEERPLIALEAALAGDHILRYSAQKILPLGIGVHIPKKDMVEHIQKEYKKDYTQKMIESITRNVLSSWAQSGHLSGKIKKIRKKATAGPASLAYALYLGQLSGVLGASLFETLFVDALDATGMEIQRYLHAAMKKGWLIHRSAGGITELTITLDLNVEEKKHG